ncbi:hypothetical protein WA026_008068 [Henosepilachna vigintioctopunctata]|uniref:Uncharacterized protein n=1 Tax=Henosepilachna vigintioctopunctata TaxID=420089 RepID=A0AAW1TRW5_9CUCU
MEANQNQWRSKRCNSQILHIKHNIKDNQLKNQNQWNQAVHKTAAHQFPNTAYQTQYQGQSSQNVNKYAAQPQPSTYGSQTSEYSSKNIGGEDDGQYHEENEEKGPPKGFFYKFDYPVGIIVSKQGPAEKGVHQGGGYQSQH